MAPCFHCHAADAHRTTKEPQHRHGRKATNIPFGAHGLGVAVLEFIRTARGVFKVADVPAPACLEGLQPQDSRQRFGGDLPRDNHVE